MYSIVQETDDSTTVNFSAYGKFLPGSGNQLVTIGAKYLRIFRTNPYALIPPVEGNDEWKQKTILECVFSTRFMSPVVSFATARIPSHPKTDCMLLAFDDGKLSIVTVEEKDNSLHTVSLHNFEDEYLRRGFTKNFPLPIVKTDPSSRCAAVLIYGRHLSIISFQEGHSHIRSFTVPLDNIDPRLDNIVDMVFLEGYYEPTLLFLYEPLQTTAGRASIRYDTLCIMGVSVNALDKQFAVVWHASNLPMDCNKLLAIPKPVGGALIFGSNEVVYLNQAVPPSGFILNSCYDSFTKFPLKDMKHLCMTLDGCVAEWIGDGRVVVGTNEGKLFIITMVADSASTVKSLEFKHAYDSSIPYTITQCAPGHLFIGSRLGDSQLLQYSVMSKESENNDLLGEGDTKRARMEEAKSQEIDDDDMELYGETVTEHTAAEIVRSEEEMWFTELDRLPNIGPIKTMTAGGAHGTSQILLNKDRIDPVFDIVTASGHGKDGSLCVLQRTVRPEIITSSSLESAQQLWAVGRREDDSHKYLIVSRTRSTLVLELGEEMVELEDPLFITSEPTVAAGELADGGLAVQVTSMCLAMVADGQQLQAVELDSNFPVVAASIVDPFVALLTQNGRLLLYQLASQPHVHLKELDLSICPFIQSSPLTSVSIYRDMSGIMICSTGISDDAEIVATASKSTVLEGEDLDLYGEGNVANDADDLLLYGESMLKKSKYDMDASRKRKRKGAVTAAVGGEQSDAVDPNTIEPTYWLVLARDTGKLSIHSLPDLSLVYQIRKFCGMPDLLLDNTADDDEKDKKDQAASAEQSSEQATENLRLDERIVEAQIVGMGINQGRPVLMSVIDDMVVAYQIFSLPNRLPEHLSIAFRRLPLTVCLRTSPYMGADGRRNEVKMGKETERQRVIVHPFERISGIMNGIVLAGAYPCLILMSSYSGLRRHPMTLDGPLRAFTAFNNRNVLNGFLYLTEATQELRIAQLSADLNYEMSYPCKKVAVGATVHHVRYIMNSQVYAVTTSTPQSCSKIWVVINDDKQEETHERKETFVLPTIQNYKINLYSPEDWSPIPNTEMIMEEMEVVTACEEVLLRSESTMSGMQTYLAVATINNYGEEVLVRGRIILSEIIEVVPEPGQPTSKHKIKVLYDAEQKGPVTSICSLNGFLLSGMGQKVFIWGFKDNELQGISFLDLHYYVHSLVSFRNIAMASDIQQTMSLIRFQEQFKALSVASRDDRLGIQPPMAAQYLVDNNHIGFLLSDEMGNLCLFNYSPEQKESNGGEKLVMNAIINLGTNINAFLRVKGHTSLCDVSSIEAKTIAEAQSTVWGSLDGSIGVVRPINEKSFRRLHFLHQFMTTGVQQSGGLNPKGSRAAKPPRPVVNAANHRNMVDGDLVGQFMHLSTAEKQDLARKLGASRYHIMDDLVNIERMAAYF